MCFYIVIMTLTMNFTFSLHYSYFWHLFVIIMIYRIMIFFFFFSWPSILSCLNGNILVMCAWISRTLSRISSPCSSAFAHIYYCQCSGKTGRVDSWSVAWSWWPWNSVIVPWMIYAECGVQAELLLYVELFPLKPLHHEYQNTVLWFSSTTPADPAL